MPAAEYDAWFKAYVPEASAGGLADKGKELFNERGMYFVILSMEQGSSDRQ